MAIIMGSGMLVVAVEMSLFVASTIRQARSIDRTLVAQYAAESAVEDALHQIRKEDRTTLREDTRAGQALYTIDGRDAQWTFEKNRPTCCVEKFSSLVQKIMKSHLGEQQSLDVHLWTHADGQFAAQSSDFVTMKVAWKKADCGEDEVPWIETTALTLAVPGTTLRWNDDATIKKDFQRPADGANSVTVQLSSLVSDGGDSLSIRIKPFFCSLRDVEISFPKEGSPTELIPIPNYYLIRPSATFGDVTKELSVIMPRFSGVTGIFDYVLFSDEKIEKVEK